MVAKWFQPVEIGGKFIQREEDVNARKLAMEISNIVFEYIKCCSNFFLHKIINYENDGQSHFISYSD